MIIVSLLPISYILYCHVCTYGEMAMRQASLGRMSGLKATRKTAEITCSMQYAVLSDGTEEPVEVLGELENSNGSLNEDDVESDDDESKQWRSMRIEGGELGDSRLGGLGSNEDITLTGVG